MASFTNQGLQSPLWREDVVVVVDLRHSAITIDDRLPRLDLLHPSLHLTALFLPNRLPQPPLSPAYPTTAPSKPPRSPYHSASPYTPPAAPPSVPAKPRSSSAPEQSASSPAPSLKPKGVSHVCVVDIHPACLAFVQSRGFADSTVCLSRIDEADPIKRATLGAAQILEQVGEKEGFDAIFKCSGTKPCIQMGMFAARPGGKLVLVGMGTPTLTMPLGGAALREVDVLGVFRYHDTWPEALALLGSAKLQGVEDLVTHRLPLNRAGEAFELVSRGVDDKGQLVMKVLVDSMTDETREDGVDGKGYQTLVSLDGRERMLAAQML